MDDNKLITTGSSRSGSVAPLNIKKRGSVGGARRDFAPSPSEGPEPASPYQESLDDWALDRPSPKVQPRTQLPLYKVRPVKRHGLKHPAKRI